MSLQLPSFLLNCLFLINIAISKKFSRPVRPHILLFVMDDVGWTDVSFHNGTGYTTPNIDNMATNGIILDRYYVQPVCSPTRAALMQGFYPFHTGMQHFNVLKPMSAAHIPEDIPTLAELLNAQNYTSHAIGKWHLGYAKWDYTPTGRGFNSHVGYYQGMVDYYDKNFSLPKSVWPFAQGMNAWDWWSNRTASFPDNGTHNLELYDAEMIRVVKDYVSKHKTAVSQRQIPLFLYMAHQIVHIPLQEPPSYLISHSCAQVPDPTRRVYCKMMIALDDALGRTVDLFKKYKLWNNTLMIVTTDNGGIPNYGDFPASVGCNYPLRAGKGTLFEGGVHGVGFVNGGENVIPSIARGTNVAPLIHVVDWLPTVLAMATDPGKSQCPRSEIDGHDIWDVLVNDALGERIAIPLDINYNITFPNNGMRLGVLKGDWKLMRRQIEGKILNYDGWYPIPPLEPIPPPQPLEDGWFLFNLNEDPYEHNNVYNKYPDKVTELKALLASYTKYIPPQPAHYDPRALPDLHNNTWSPWLE